MTTIEMKLNLINEKVDNMIKNKKVAGNTEVVKSVDSPKIELVELPVKKETVKNEKVTA